MSDIQDSITVDSQFGLAYLKLRGTKVAKTIPVSESVIIDYDDADAVVGVEFLFGALEETNLQFFQDLEFSAEEICALEKYLATSGQGEAVGR